MTMYSLNKVEISGNVKNYEMSNDGWYFRGNYYEPPEYPDSYIESLIFQADDGYEMEIGEVVTIKGDFSDYHPKLGIFNVSGEWDLFVVGKREADNTYYLKGLMKQ